MEAPVDVSGAGELAAVEHRCVAQLSAHDRVDLWVVLVEAVEGSHGGFDGGEQWREGVRVGDAVHGFEVRRYVVVHDHAQVFSHADRDFPSQRGLLVSLGYVELREGFPVGGDRWGAARGAPSRGLPGQGFVRVVAGGAGEVVGGDG